MYIERSGPDLCSVRCRHRDFIPDRRAIVRNRHRRGGSRDGCDRSVFFRAVGKHHFYSITLRDAGCIFKIDGHETVHRNREERAVFLHDGRGIVA